MTIDEAIQDAREHIAALAEDKPDRMRVRAALEALLRVSEVIAQQRPGPVE